MPKFTYSPTPCTPNGSASTATPSRIFKIYYFLYFRSHLDFISPMAMKRSVRPLFSILLLAVFAATIGCRSILRRGFADSHLSLRPPPPLFNSTFLRYASTDIGEPKAKLEIQQLLEGNFESVGWLKKIRRHPQTRSQTLTSSSSSSRVPLFLRSPAFYRHFADFRRLLQDWSRRKRFHPEIMSDMVTLVKQPLDRHNGRPASSGHRYASCAVVGNSGILLNSNYGELIDDHEVVIRLNNARVKRFERNVGSKTSLSFVNSNILHLCARRQTCFCHPYGEKVPMLMYICQPIHFLDYAVCNSTHQAPLLVTDPRFDVLCAQIVKYYSVKRFVEETGKPLEEWPSTHDGSMFHYSSGMQAVMLAVGICDKVSIFGFGKSVTAHHHYHTNQKAELRLHDYEAEYSFYHDLVENPKVIPFISDKFKFPSAVMYQ